MIEAGDQAPDFELPDQDGPAVKVGGFAEEMVVLYFCPEADTWECRCITRSRR
jgi:thioredoxin-dependent peroxiredoxin